MNKNILRGFPEDMVKNNKPIFFGIHLKPVCNFRCTKCFIGDMNNLKIQKNLSLKEIKQIILSAKKNGFKVLGITGAGEPTLDKRIKEMVSFANKNGLITHIPTNASLLTIELLKFFKANNVTLILSLDTLDKNKFVNLSGTNEKMFTTVIKNISLAQNIFKDTMIVKDNKNIYRLAIHTTISDQNINEINEIKQIVTKDTLFSISSIAGNEMSISNEITEKHIVEVFDKTTKRNICGFFRFGIDLNFDGQLLLDAHAIQTSKVLPNIRDFNLNIKKAFDFLKPIKINFIKKHMPGFCPVRSNNIKAWIKNMAIKQDIKKSILQGEPLLKFSYLNKGANKFIQVLNSKEYYTTKNELKIIKENKKELQSFLKQNIVVLGVGNGDKIKELLPSTNKHLTLIDISEDLLKITKEKVPAQNLTLINDSFENIDFTKFKNSTFIIFGGTLFNKDNWEDLINLLKKESINSNLIIGIELLNGIPINEIIKQYNNETGFNFISQPLNLIGIKKKSRKIKVNFNKRKNKIEEWFISKTPIFNKKKILLSISIKINEKSFIKKINQKNIKFNFKEDDNHILGIKL